MKHASCSSCSKFLSEFLGTAILVFVGIGAAVMNGGIGALGIGLAFGLTLMVLVYTLGPVSGSHVNPAVTLTMFFSGHMNIKDTVMYIVAQLLGGAFGAWLVYMVATGRMDFNMMHGFAANGFGEHSPAHYSMHSVMLVEILMTAILAMVVMATMGTSFAAGFNGLVIGGTLVVGHLISLPVSNTSMNFARSFASAFMERGWAMEQLWVFALTSAVAAALAAVLYKWVLCHKMCSK